MSRYQRYRSSSDVPTKKSSADRKKTLFLSTHSRSLLIFVKIFNFCPTAAFPKYIIRENPTESNSFRSVTSGNVRETGAIEQDNTFQETLLAT